MLSFACYARERESGFCIEEAGQYIDQSYTIRLCSVGKFDLITAAPEHFGQIQFAI